jgi:phosphate transport system substrate-binding protein
VVSRTPGALTYVDVAYALVNKIKFMSVKNKAGKYTSPGLRGIKAAASLIKKVPPGNEMHIVDPPATLKTAVAYPICTFTYVLLPEKTDKAQMLRRFVFYALTTGQTFGPKLLFVPIPTVVLVASEKTLKKVTPST